MVECIRPVIIHKYMATILEPIHKISPKELQIALLYLSVGCRAHTHAYTHTWSQYMYIDIHIWWYILYTIFSFTIYNIFIHGIDLDSNQRCIRICNIFACAFMLRYSNLPGLDSPVQGRSHFGHVVLILGRWLAIFVQWNPNCCRFKPFKATVANAYGGLWGRPNLTHTDP